MELAAVVLSVTFFASCVAFVRHVETWLRGKTS